MDAPLDSTNLVALERSHEDLLIFCLRVEEIADSLQLGIDKQDCLDVSQNMLPLLKQTHLIEEQILFPDFDRNAGSRFAGTMIQSLKAEHRCDALACAETMRTLTDLAEGRNALVADTVRYMLNGFVESVRRHISLEKLMIEALLVARSEGREILA